MPSLVHPRLSGAVALWAATAWPQAEPAASRPEVIAQDAPVTFSSRVNLVYVPVVVRDREGRTAGNLRKEDFRLLDKGKPQVISKFSMEKSNAPAAGAKVSTGAEEKAPSGRGEKPVLPERYVAYLFDDIHLKPGDLLQTRQAVNRHLDESPDFTARAAILTTSGMVLAEFTADREKLHQAVNRVQPYTRGPDPQQDCPAISYPVADVLVNQFHYLDGALFSDQQLLGMINSGQVDQALSAVYAEVSCNGACMVGQTDTLTGADICLVQALINAKTAARLALTYGDRETANALGALRDIVRKLSAMPGSRNLVLVSPGFLLTRDHRSDEYDLLDRAIRANVTVNTIDMRGLFTAIAGGDASQSAYHTPPRDADPG
jgi:VWFA-related protein